MYGRTDTLSFEHTTYKNLYNEILLLNPSKANPKDTIPPNVIDANCDIFALKLHIDFNISIDTGNFPVNLKLSDITPVHKKGDRTDKTEYRPVSILPAISKVFEKLLFYQINDFINPKLSKNQSGFRKGFSAQLIVMLQKWKKSLDNKGFCGVLLTDLSKAFDCLDHCLFIAKLEAYGFDNNALLLIHSYLTNRYQRVRINSNYSLWSEIINGAPHGLSLKLN